ncbi:hypothetical protein Q31a_17430 [Aureliella helgolandensis]|uniref:Uncharacterized protein n=1 Tax=Aureliella helgolandensis TaxID=2527968 RepID=A0A518G4D2_9BACT|nr:hypothetical protein Q31a_17430 [Aureliella helgolandensis]
MICLMKSPKPSTKLRKRKSKPPLPPRYRWPRGTQPPTARRPCKHCGELDRAVSSRELLTYYGPTRCSCGAERPLRKVERPIDWAALRAQYAIPRDMQLG